MNFALSLAQNKVPGVRTTMANSGRAELEAALVPAGLSASTRESIENALKEREVKADLLAGLLLGSPEFQRR